ncbi:predicted protein [Postia placenta Mad-698-R]|uniref:Man(5)GlcNAc(2)-PP-dolichol translocation protein RFT1 n=1 Tax=Rhodonia placenta TaxID=104341 RepID=A0A8H7NW69_9APHY|nr:predicted protein [Postia placenta Mad-698-R]KAF9806951.1 hypothetical protein IEO21_08441 [Postia placenta]
MESLRVAANVLSGVLLLFTHLLLLLVTFGPPYLALAVSLVLPQKYQGTSAPAILGVYIYYIPMMAFNGVLEAFFASVSSPEDLGTQSKWMFGFSFGYIFGAITLAKGLGLGDTGLVWANVVNLLFRAIYAWMYARRFFAARGGRSFLDWQRVVPPLPVLVTFVASAVITRWSEMRSRDIPLQLGAQAGHVALGMCGVVACVVTCLTRVRNADLTANTTFDQNRRYPREATANIDKVDSTTQSSWWFSPSFRTVAKHYLVASANSTPQVVVVQQRKPSFKEEVILRKPETKEHGEKILSGEASFNPKQRE